MRLIIAACLAALTAVSCVAERRIDAVGNEMLGSRFQLAVDEMKALHSGLELPDYLAVKDAKKRGNELDVQRYFSVLTRIRMQEGYVLDYVYRFDGMGGAPVLYARKKTQLPFASEKDLIEATRGSADSDGPGVLRNKPGSKDAQNCDGDSYLDHVRIDGTKEGFLEYVALQLLGGQFYLCWHAGYNDRSIIASRSGLQRLVEKQAELLSGRAMTAALRAKAMRIDCSPTVEIGQKETAISIVTFTAWGGFSRERFLVRTEFPHTIIRQMSSNLLYYDCGIRF